MAEEEAAFVYQIYEQALNNPQQALEILISNGFCFELTRGWRVPASIGAYYLSLFFVDTPTEALPIKLRDGTEAPLPIYKVRRF